MTSVTSLIFLRCLPFFFFFLVVSLAVWTPAMVNPSPIFKPPLGLRASFSDSFQQHNKFTLPLLGVGRKR
jgi:hypothetical protein